ncbi:MAG: hypothetical protein KAR83_03375, partial [Thermodesulfovibrionales bacterium]|nr:hypothetical protein [Thermodesulfovibrionales bacterium]
MRRKAFPYYVLTGIALILLFIVSCGNQDGGSPVVDSGDPAGNSAGMRDAMGGFIDDAFNLTNAIDDDQSNPSSAYDIGQNVFFTVWADARHQDPYGKDIYGAFINAFDGAIMSEIVIANSTGNEIQPSVAFDWRNKRGLVAFTNSADKHIWGRFVNATTYNFAGMGDNFPIAMLNSTVDRTVPYGSGQIAVAGTVTNTVGTADGTNGTFSIDLLSNPPVPNPAFINMPYGSGVANITAATSVSFGTLGIFEDGVQVGWEDAFNGIISGSRTGGPNATQTSSGVADTYTYPFTLTNTPVATGTVDIVYDDGSTTDRIAYDDGFGTFILNTPNPSGFPTLDIVQSAVDYNTGVVSLVFENDVTSYKFSAGAGVEGPYDATLINSPIKPGSLYLYSGATSIGSDLSGSGTFDSPGGELDVINNTPTIDYWTGVLNDIYFSTGNYPAIGVDLTATYTINSPQAGDTVSLDYITGSASNLFNTAASYVDYSDGMLYLDYTAGLEPLLNVEITSEYQYSQNSELVHDISYYTAYQESPHVVYNEVDDLFHVTWLSTTNKSNNVHYQWTDPNYVCSNGYNDGNGWNDTSGDTNIFDFTYVLEPGVDSKMVRYRNVSFDDYLKGDGDDGSGSTDDYIDEIYNYGYDLDGDGTPDDMDGDGIADLDFSPIDSEIIDASKFRYNTFKEEFVCEELSETLTVTLALTEYNFESDPHISYNPVNGNPVALWSGQDKTIDLVYVWNRTGEKKTIDGVEYIFWKGWKETKTGPGFSANSAQRIVAVTNDFNTWYDNYLEVAGSSADRRPWAATDIYTENMLVVWESQNATDKDIYGQFIEMQNFQTDVGDQIEISTEQFDQSVPRVSFDSVNERFMVIWEDARNTAVNLSNMDIFGQFVDGANGQLSGSNFSITVNTGNQQQPSVAFGDFDRRKFLITWKDGRDPGNADIYGQLWAFSEAPQLQITDDQDNPIYDQTINFGGIPVYSSDE